MNKRIIHHPLFFPLFAIGLFLFLAFVFTILRRPIGSLNQWLLLMTGEVNLRKTSSESGSGSYVSSTRRKSKKNVKKRVATKKRKPEKCRLPKTAPCYALYVNAEPKYADVKKLPLLPPLRKYTGEVWTKEKTEIRIATDGNKLYFYCWCYDKHPEDIITRFSRQNPDLSWKDDSIEFFLMKDRNADKYIQYVTSASGRGAVYYMQIKNKNNKATGSRSKIPDGFAKPLMDSEDFNGGYLITMQIDIKNNFGYSLKPGDTILFQIVRNYRGQAIKGCLTLHMFPTYIYVDNNDKAKNHHRDGFQALQIVDKTELKKIQQKGVIFKDVHLRKLIASLLNINNTQPIAADTLKQIKTLNASGKQIFSLEGIEYCSNLETLDLSSNRIRDITPLFWLTNLKQLNLSNNKIDNIDALIGCKKLKILKLANNRIRKFPVSALSGFDSIETLDISNNKFLSIDRILTFKKLKNINLKNAFTSKNKEQCENVISKIKDKGIKIIE